MKVFTLISALILGSTLPLTLPAAAANKAHRSMTVRLANGKRVTFRVVRYHGTMMAMIPAADLSDVFHRPH